MGLQPNRKNMWDDTVHQKMFHAIVVVEEIFCPLDALSLGVKLLR